MRVGSKNEKHRLALVGWGGVEAFCLFACLMTLRGCATLLCPSLVRGPNGRQVGWAAAKPTGVPTTALILTLPGALEAGQCGWGTESWARRGKQGQAKPLHLICVLSNSRTSCIYEVCPATQGVSLRGLFSPDLGKLRAEPSCSVENCCPVGQDAIGDRIGSKIHRVSL